MHAAPAIQRLLDELERLPGIGPKSAARLAYFILNQDTNYANRLAEAITGVKEQIHFCPLCFNYAQGKLCEICSAPKRQNGMICVVERPADIAVIEKSGSFFGRYHVLGGAISPMDGVGPDDLHVAELMARIPREGVREVIIATNPNVEGESTAAYLSRMLRPLGVKTTRPASGLPVGGEMEFIDELTLSRALDARIEM